VVVLGHDDDARRRGGLERHGQASVVGTAEWRVGLCPASEGGRGCSPSSWRALQLKGARALSLGVVHVWSVRPSVIIVLILILGDPSTHPPADAPMWNPSDCATQYTGQG